MIHGQTLLPDEGAIAEANEALRALAEMYPDYAMAELDSFSLALARLQSGEASHGADDLFRAAHNLKGQGAAFGYELITTFGDLLCGLVRGSMIHTAAGQTRAAHLVDACRNVLKQRLTGDGGQAGSQLLARVCSQTP